MYIYKYDKRPLIENSQSISASVFVRNYYLDLKKSVSLDNKYSFNFNDEQFVKDLIVKIEQNSTVNLKQEINGKIEFTEPNRVKLTYTKSNLGKGFVFWFICPACGKRVRYLYIPPYSEVSACRRCHRLVYEKQNDNKRFRGFNKFF
ncbi:hypothetical protein COY87_01640 [Candidatus Roizmanbacteria bacterium CG_4_10_14_0_8_um_filter_33_9]|uniref:Uncharacterized protein n=1 Tax=Candidatus Roizmanbacteria bacterium CG_4_10_14_0_8_um_filter_33_9 TaxID=1974826 RepID=A0A2M7QJ18_9BACT|nr:MAG: hypothetical protein COY87_01640 [Candidatus Roizmanbacteria bacterium CG_4_10_14_0_8_um_filter_33_9]